MIDNDLPYRNMAESEVGNDTTASVPSREVLIHQIQSRLDSITPHFDILRSGEFCNAEAFLDDIPMATIEFIDKATSMEPAVIHAGLLSHRSESELMKSVRNRTATDLEISIILGSLAIKTMYKDDPNRGIIVSMFGRGLRWKWQLNGKEDAKQLDDAIYYFQKTVETEPENEANRALHFDDLGCALWERYTRQHIDDDFQASEQAFKNAADLPHSGKPMFLSNLGRLYKDKAIYSENKDLMKKSIEIHLEAISCVGAGFLGSIRSLHKNLAISYLEIYPVAGSTENKLDSLVEEKVEASGFGWMFYYELALMLTERFRKSGQQNEADMSISLLRNALPATNNKNIVMSALADILEQKGLSVDSPDMVREAQELSGQVLDSINEYNPDFFSVSLNTAVLLTRRYMESEDTEYVEKAIAVTRRALSSSLIGERRWKFEQILGIQLGYRFQASENIADLEEGILSIKAAMDTTTDNLTSFDRGTNLSHYGLLLFQRFKMLQKREDLDASIHSLETSLDIFGPEQNSVAAVYNDLGIAFNVKFEITGKVEDVHKAIDYHKEALAAIDRFPILAANKPMYYFGLGNTFFLSYETWDQAADLSQAIVFYEEAVKNTRPQDMRRFTRIGSLCRMLLHKYHVMKDRKSLTMAQKILQDTLVGPPVPNPRQISFLQNILGHSYLYEYDASENDLSFLDNAAQCFSIAANSGSTIPSDINPPTVNLAKALVGKYSKTKSDIDFLKAAQQILQLRNILSKLNVNSREMRGLAETLGNFSTEVYDIKKAPQFGMMGLTAYTLVAQDETAFPERRLWALIECARLTYEINQDAVKARETLVNALQILPEAIPIGPNRGDQLRSAKRLKHLPRLLISFSIAAGDDSADTLLLYEQSRSLLWNRLIDSKTDLSRLREADEDLAAKFEHLRINLNRASPPAVVTAMSTDNRINHHNVNREYQETLRLIRGKPSFERFLLLDEPSELVKHATNGPVIILNATKYRGDAIIITVEGVIGLPLPGFVQEECIAQAAHVKGAFELVTTTPQQAFSMFTAVMKWLWNVVASPIFEKLGYLGQKFNNNNLPRVWWVSSVWFCYLPIHAAGDHARAKETGDTCTVMDRVISTYIPTLRALDFVRKSARRFSEVRPQLSQALLVKMPTTPDDIDLPNVAQEIDSIKNILGDLTYEVTTLDRPKRNNVIAVLQKASIAHFACHGTAEYDDPSQNKLKLQDWKTSPLDVRFLLRIASFKHLELVYLSACETAVSKDLVEDSVHVSSAFQMAGVPYTIASAWKMEDNMSTQLARNFYADLKALGDGSILDYSKSAFALHSAVKRARDSGAEPLLWGALMHCGA